MRGLVSILIATLFFGFMVLFTKIVSLEISSSEIIFFRSLVGVLFVLSFIFISGKWTKLKSGNKQLLFWRGVIGASAQLLWFYAISKINVAPATLLNNSYPIFATVFALILLKERIKVDTLLALAIAFTGLLIVFFPAPLGLSFGYLAGLASGMFAGGAILTIRKLRQTDSSWVIFLSFSAAGLLLSAPFTFYKFTTPSFNGWWFLLLVGLCSAMGQMFLTYGFKYAQAAEGSVVAMCTTISAAILGIIFLKELLTLQFILGATLVLCGGAYLILKERFVGRFAANNKLT